MQLDYKDIIIKHYALSMSGSEIARQTGFSKSGVNDFLRAFKKCEDLPQMCIHTLSWRMHREKWRGLKG